MESSELVSYDEEESIRGDGVLGFGEEGRVEAEGDGDLGRGEEVRLEDRLVEGEERLEDLCVVRVGRRLLDLGEELVVGEDGGRLKTSVRERRPVRSRQ